MPRNQMRLVLTAALRNRRATGSASVSVSQELITPCGLLRHENRLLRDQLKGRVRLTKPERVRFAEIGKRFRRKPSRVRPRTERSGDWRIGIAVR